MISLKLPKTLEKQFQDFVQKNYEGDLQFAIRAFLQLHKKYAWKEQFLEDIKSIRSEVRLRGGVKEKDIADAITKYRNQTVNSGE